MKQAVIFEDLDASENDMARKFRDPWGMKNEKPTQDQTVISTNFTSGERFL